MADGERWAIFDDADDTTLLLHAGRSQLSIEVSAGRIEFVYIDAEMQRSNVMTACKKSKDVRSLLRAMMQADESTGGP